MSRPPAADRAMRTVACPYCGRETSVAREAISVPCAACNRRIELEDLQVTENIGRDLMTGASVLIRKEATVFGSIHAGEIIVHGMIRGDLWSSGRVLLSPSARVIGDIRAWSLVLEDGASVTGRLDIGTRHKPRR
ncbi:polymer-forming cytoskeletal protein [Candidatus Fermentibacteria bacterium]|nr:polymer-forming cytoskeletal protein [Candidatus Fermentibacteria bacterium]